MSEASVFAVKSTANSLSFFENSVEYVHIFFCSEKDGPKVAGERDDSPSDSKVASSQRPLLPRSHFIDQERNISVGTTSGSTKTNNNPSALWSYTGLRG